MNDPWKTRLSALPLFLALPGLFVSCTENSKGDSAVVPQKRAEPRAQAKLLAEKPAKSKFIRFTKKGKNSGVLETAIVAYEDKSGRRVDLIAAVHLGETEYYKELEKLFENYEQLLYEMIKPKDTNPGRRSGNNSILSLVQRALKDVLDLQFQLDAIDYGKKNFVHADLDVESFLAKLKERNETVLSILLRAVLAGMAKQEKSSKAGLTPLHLVAALFSKNRASYLKFHLAQELEDIEEILARLGWDDDEKGSAIIHDRNKKAIAVLEAGLQTAAKNFGIFYGAAHMPDLEKRLQKLGFQKKSQRWLTAWDASKSQ